ncbi:RNA 2',3'-cyclic phosphodiesterase [Dictyobacter aurantiacus]|uniref:RNA 2',3'-cyclic phosphodiesterase n=1 Tax=Dictyobacter aurantiacus TaxID=1936993 RepID=A0A401ZHR2_9CHLR|nr:RNA 2',3'-cyclic phosphodiesterase [Dictyobacter aurantiacus]GCE06421.1 RNA 2',3'-cyclic phosphodiesterase [Dictyobacter aurantiacus]
MTRTFIALEMNEHMQRHLSGFIHQVAPALPGLRWVDPRGIHLTLAFLGELDDEQLTLTYEAAQQAARKSRPFSYSLTHPGIFGTLRQPRVLWMGIDEPSGALQYLYRLLQKELVQRDFTGESRPFSPHLTLARAKAPLNPTEQAALQKILAPNYKAGSTQPYPASHIHVMKSELSRTGATYTVLQEYSLQ